jgi:hypothetical protein
MSAIRTTIDAIPIRDGALAREVTSRYRLRHYEEDR